jgi:hypothetical protein
MMTLLTIFIAPLLPCMMELLLLHHSSDVALSPMGPLQYLQRPDGRRKHVKSLLLSKRSICQYLPAAFKQAKYFAVAG